MTQAIISELVSTVRRDNLGAVGKIDSAPRSACSGIRFQRLQYSTVRGVDALEIEYQTREPLYLRFRNRPGLHIHLRQRGTGVYSIDNSGVINGRSTEMQVYCSPSVWQKSVFENDDVSPRNMLFGLTGEMAIKLLGGTAEGILGHACQQTYHSRLSMRPELVNLVDELFDLAAEGIAGIKREARLLDVLALSLTSLQTSVSSGVSGYRLRPADIARLRGIEQHIAQNLSADLSIERLAFIAGMSVSRFKWAFQELSGYPVGTYVRDCRMRVAADLLGQGRTVAEVASRVGYKHPGHFARVFRDVHGSAPRDVRTRSR